MTLGMCDVCFTSIRKVLDASLFLDVYCRERTLLAHDRCVPLRVDQPNRFYYIGLDRIVAADGHSNSLASWVRHLSEKEWFNVDDIEMLKRAHAAACAANERRIVGGTRVQPGARLRTQVLERDRFRCRRCGGVAPDVRLVLDHVVPVAAGGKTVLDNLQTLCWECNSGKCAAMPTDHDMRGLSGLEQ